MARGEPGQSDGDCVFDDAEGGVRKRFRGRRYGGAGGGFAAVSDEGDGGSQESREQLVLRGELAGRAVSEESSHGDADEGMKRVPDEVEGGDLVSEELDGEQDCARSYNGPSLKKLESRRKR